LQKKGYLFFPDKTYPNLGRVCIIETAKNYLRWEKLEPDHRPYYDAYPYVDIYQTYPQSGNFVEVRHGPPCKFETSTVFPLGITTIYDKPFFAPHNTTQYLKQLYGPKFMEIPPKGKRSPHGAYSDACKADWQN